MWDTTFRFSCKYQHRAINVGNSGDVFNTFRPVFWDSLWKCFVRNSFAKRFSILYALNWARHWMSKYEPSLVVQNLLSQIDDVLSTEHGIYSRGVHSRCPVVRLTHRERKRYLEDILGKLRHRFWIEKVSIGRNEVLTMSLACNFKDVDLHDLSERRWDETTWSTALLFHIIPKALRFATHFEETWKVRQRENLSHFPSSTLKTAYRRWMLEKWSWDEKGGKSERITVLFSVRRDSPPEPPVLWDVRVQFLSTNSKTVNLPSLTRYAILKRQTGIVSPVITITVIVGESLPDHMVSERSCIDPGPLEFHLEPEIRPQKTMRRKP